MLQPECSSSARDKPFADLGNFINSDRYGANIFIYFKTRNKSTTAALGCVGKHAYNAVAKQSFPFEFIQIKGLSGSNRTTVVSKLTVLMLDGGFLRH